MNQRKDSAHHKRALKEARMAKLLFSFIALASIAIVIFILNILWNIYLLKATVRNIEYEDF